MKSVATFTWLDLLQATQGEVAAAYRSFDAVPLQTDTRQLEAGHFYVPLVGESFDGQNFIEQAYNAGASGALVSKAFLAKQPQLQRYPNLIVVENTLKAYQDLAQFHRRRSKATIIAITGSSGKTTTKEMLYLYLSSQGPTQATEKNYNNEIGVPHTLLQLRPDTKYLIVEMAMRGLGQIEELTLCAEPNLALVTNIGPAHIGLLGSLQAIAKAKCEIFKGLLATDGVGIINGDDPLLIRQANLDWSGQLETFSLAEVEHIKRRPEGGLMFDYNDVTFHLGIPGRHQVMNALACIKVCELLGLPLKKLGKVLGWFRGTGQRWSVQPVDKQQHWWIINDAYNANPDSMRASLEAFIGVSFYDLVEEDTILDEEDQPVTYKKVAVLGEMSELGDFSHDYHLQLGDWLSAKGGLDQVVVVGAGAKAIFEGIQPDGTSARYFETQSEAVDWLAVQPWDRALILLKASRSCALEKMIEALESSRASVISSS